jgi:hypothetical protein
MTTNSIMLLERVSWFYAPYIYVLPCLVYHNLNDNQTR